MNTTERQYFPSLRCKLGDWIYYPTFLTFGEVSNLVNEVQEIHNSKRLEDWIQRSLQDNHAKKISTYLQNQEQRFFNSIVVGVYGGDVKWHSIDLRPSSLHKDIEESTPNKISNSIGLLELEGTETLFAIDGQHRVVGIKKAIQEDPNLANDEICVLFVGHIRTQEGQERTRRLFTTLNKTAKNVSKRDIIALDEDNSFAIIIRALVDRDDSALGDKWIALNSTANITSPRDDDKITSIISLYNILNDFYSAIYKTKEKWPSNGVFSKSRADKTIIESVYSEFNQYWEELLALSPPFQKIINGDSEPSDFRTSDNSYLLARPIGQRVFASAVGILISRDFKLKEAIEKLLEVDLWIHKECWHDILWDNSTNSIRTKSQDRLVAIEFLLAQIEEPPHKQKNKQLLIERIKTRDN